MTDKITKSILTDPVDVDRYDANIYRDLMERGVVDRNLLLRLHKQYPDMDAKKLFVTTLITQPRVGVQWLEAFYQAFEILRVEKLTNGD